MEDIISVRPSVSIACQTLGKLILNTVTIFDAYRSNASEEKESTTDKKSPITVDTPVSCFHFACSLSSGRVCP